MKRILIIEDDIAHSRMLKAVLSKEGYDVSTAVDGREGCELFNASQCDLVISDIFMPEKEGLETITELNERNPEIKIIAMSGGSKTSKYGAKDILEIAEDLGATRVISKPINIPELLKIVQSLIEDS